jgi:tetratricopeptide (TPR) repeat protein
MCLFQTDNLLLAQNQTDIQLANEYLLRGDKNKALDIYRDLVKSDANIPYVHNNYFNTLLDLGETEEAQNYLKRLQKRDPENLQYKIETGIIYVRTGDMSKADRYFRDLIQAYKTNVSRIKMIADYLSSKSLSEYSILALNESRQALNNPYMFSLELAMLYRIKGEKDKMVIEYLNYVTQTSANIQYVKNVMQALLTKPDELESLERILYERIQKNPDMEVYSDLIIWVTMQQKNFYASFIQARAYDRRYNKLGERCMEVARVALDNEDYVNALRSYQYVAREYPNGPYFLQARLGLIKTREARIRNTYPVAVDSVKNLITEYNRFISEYENNTHSHEAQRSEALLYANYLGQPDKAIELLQQLIDNPRVALQIKSKSKLDLGDIYLITGETWESSLLYSQVEKALKESPLGYEAKLKNAKLFYYKGNFRLAQEHLDILKEATTREIANDAMELSMLIKENIAFDSVGEALKVFSNVELLLYQNRTNEALIQISSLKEGYAIIPLYDGMLIMNEKWEAEAFKAKLGDTINVAGRAIKKPISNSVILDEVYMLESKIWLQKGEFEKSIELLQKILVEYPDDILADDAFFLEGEIYDRQLGNKDKAMELYREFLNRFPGSVYAAEARKRFRTLRGDFIEQPQL